MANQPVKPRYQDLYGSEYTAPEDIPPTGLRVQFTRWDIRLLKCAGAKDSWKVVLWAKTADGKPLKKLVAVNKTSAKQLARIWGKPIAGPDADDYAPWLGKTADLSHVKIKAFGDLKDAVLISPVVQPVQGQRYDDAYAPDEAEIPPDAPQPIQRPQAKPPTAPMVDKAPVSTPQPVEAAQSQETHIAQDAERIGKDAVNTETGEVFTDTLDEPAAQLKVSAVTFAEPKKPGGKRTYFITCSDSRIYFTQVETVAQDAQIAKDQGNVVQIDTDPKPTENKGKEYWRIINMQVIQ